ncbi:mercuric reductase [Pedobacter sp. Leaf41]|uniref:mercuric reductase n=1 Tax=Pedobacter sp. Leaf41 TaxID=1736218 RepID=UPI000702F153|nr:mercuric reductase [Pedobacter sp. Leaf41]KQN35043.1 mercuric reductase [Pedobacter sp. Leaf41]
MKHYDVIIIGAGQAGIPLAKKLANAGMKTALVEKRIVGGTCINDGCTPTKTMIASARAAFQAKNAEKLGVVIGDIKVDLKEIKKRKDGIVKLFQESAQKGIESTKGLKLYMGAATFIGKKELKVEMNDGGSENLSADLIFINTGASTVIPEIKGLNEVEYLTSTSILDLTEIPEHLVIIGGNYIGLEFGQMFSRFGSKVTILEKSSHVLAREDHDVSDEICKVLGNEDIKFLTSVEVSEIKKVKSGLTISLKQKSENKSITCTHILVAAGRKPQTENLGLNYCGVKTNEKGHVIVNTKLETNVKGIYALGDVNGGPAFTHIAYNDHVIIYQNLVKKKNISTKGRPVPYCMFTDPQLARIGISENEAKERGLNYKVALLPMANVARGIETGETFGLMKAVVDTKTKKILGATVIAADGGEIMSVLQMAMQGGITYDKIRYGIFAHPTYTESLNNLFMRLDD